jgi:hydroxypyruvate isomerase
VVEHLNPLDVDGPLLPTPAAAAAFVEDVGHPGVRLLFDAYHAARAGLDPLAEIPPVAHVIGHAQYADSPGRGAPGTGTVDLDAVIARLGEAGYSGHLGLEFVPEGRTGDALGFLRGR